eukprot:m.334204 g.334204  ORF g.334204 m.334204 type:complete len:320 (-) comp16068_c0_seq16:2190-3149(-)
MTCTVSSVTYGEEVQPIVFAPPSAEWFHGRMGRDDARAILSDKPESAFLVRESLTSHNISISLRLESGVKHFRVIAHELGNFYIGEHSFAALGDVVEYFYNHVLSDNVKLRYPVKPDVTSDYSRTQRVVVAMFDHVAESPKQLSFNVGERFTVLTEGPWLLCEKDDKSAIGLVPPALVEDVGTELERATSNQLPPAFHRIKWLHGRIDRHQAANLLKKHPPGAFLFRESDAGNYAISFNVGSAIRHSKVYNREGRYELGGRAFSCLEEIVLRYITEAFSDNIKFLYPVQSVGSHVHTHTFHLVEGLWLSCNVLTGFVFY